jgi:hypothetical protein
MQNGDNVDTDAIAIVKAPVTVAMSACSDNDVLEAKVVDLSMRELGAIA